MSTLIHLLLPELILAAVACALFLLGIARGAGSRKLAAFMALLALVVAVCIQLARINQLHAGVESDPWNLGDTIRVNEFSQYIKLIAAGVGILFVLLAWPTNENATGNSALSYGADAGEFFGLMLLSICGIFLVAGANDIILLFLGIELASIPTYILVSISRPIPAAQEAGVKYFFLGAMSAAIMLFGFSYLYGTTGTIKLDEVSVALWSQPMAHVGPHELTRNVLLSWQMLAVVMLIAGFAFKMAVVPLHFYAGDVYQGAATPVTALLSFVPKITGLVATIKILATIGGPNWVVPDRIGQLLWVLAALTMTVGNVLGLLQYNVKRVFAYSSIAHSGYMLVGLTALAAASPTSDTKFDALQGVLFYITAYGIMNAGAFGVLMLIPSRNPAPATSAETFEDLAGQGRKHVGLGLAMAVCCFSLIGLPLTIGFFGKLFLIKPALEAQLYGLVVITMINAAISAAYYLRIVATMFLRSEPAGATYCSPAPTPIVQPVPIVLAIVLSVTGTLLFGVVLPATDALTGQAKSAASLHSAPVNTAKVTSVAP